MPHGLIRYGRHEWTVRDRILAVALTMHDEGLCGGCGHPVKRSHNADMEGFYEPVVTTCIACAAKESRAKDEHGNGLRVGVIDTSYDEGYEPNPALLPGWARKALDRADDQGDDGSHDGNEHQEAAEDGDPGLVEV